jgi:hypothetical protein
LFIAAAAVCSGSSNCLPCPAAPANFTQHIILAAAIAAAASGGELYPTAVASQLLLLAAVS